MAKPKDSEIERLLRKVVKDAAKKEEEITIRIARSKVETELGLEDGFLKNDSEWKDKSKAIIETAFQEDDEPQPTVRATPVQSITKARPGETPTPASKEVKEKSQPQKRSKETLPKARQPPSSTSNAPKSALAKSEEAQVDQSEDDSCEGTSAGEEDESDEAEDHAQGQLPAGPEKPEKTAPEVKGVKRKADDQGATYATESDHDDEVDTDDEHKDKKAKLDSTSGSEESSEEEDEGGSDDEEGSDEQVPAKDNHSHEASRETSQPVLQAIPAKPYKPPLGYTVLTSDHLQANEAFSLGSIEGKQIWHITAPSNLPQSTITDIALDDIQAGTVILTHDNLDYVIHEDPADPSDNTAILAPANDGYRQLEQKVGRSLRIEQKVNLPNISLRQASQSAGSLAAGEIAQPSTTTIRPQPKGLRMRYKPPGFGRGRPGMIGSESDSADDDEAGQSTSKATFQFPRALGAYGTSTGKVAGGAETSADAEQSTPVTTKKKRKEKNHLHVSPAMTNGVSVSPEARMVTPANKPEDAHGSPLPNGDGPEAESREEKARRKEEKRLKRERKEAKRKGQESIR